MAVASRAAASLSPGMEPERSRTMERFRGCGCQAWGLCLPNSFDCAEPAHVHARRDRAACKFWLDPVQLATNHGFTLRELAAVRRIIILNRDRILEAWREHCGATE
jgi:hypothetical protein